MLDRHVLFRRMDAELDRRVREAYLERLDPDRWLFTDAERGSILSSLELINAEVAAGRCDGLVALNERVTRRHSTAAAFARAMLSGKEVPDVAAAPSAALSGGGLLAGMEDLRPLLERSVNRRLAEASEIVEARASEFVVRRYETVARQQREQGEIDVYAVYLEAFAHALDPSSAYLSPVVLEDFQIGVELNLTGVGVALSARHGAIVVERTLPGGPAAGHGGLRAGDEIVAIAQEGQDPVYVLGWQLRDVVKLVRGPAASQVRLIILRDSRGREMEVALMRRALDPEVERARLSFETLERGGRTEKLAVLTLPSLYGARDSEGPRSWEDVAALLRQAMEEGADGLLLDLRDNSGGLLDAAARVTGLFIGSGGVAATRGRSGHISVLHDDDERVHYGGPLVVLTSRGTASGGEIVAGALRDYRRAVIVGEGRTLGSGTVQSVMLLSGSVGAIKVTTSYVYRPSGQSPQAVGVASDIPLPPLHGTGKAEREESELPASAISAFLDENTAIPAGVTRTSPGTVTTLEELSRRRVGANPSFTSPTPELYVREAAEVLADLVHLARSRAGRPPASRSRAPGADAARRIDGGNRTVPLATLSGSRRSWPLVEDR